MERVEKDGDWSLFCPNEAPGLADVHGEEFNKLYESYEKSGKARRTIKAQQLWFAILDAQVETGTPYMLVRCCGDMGLSVDVVFNGWRRLSTDT